MIDTWNYHRGGLQEYLLLTNNPHEYFTNLFYNYDDSNGLHSFFGSKDSYWNDLKSNVFIKFLSILDIFSFGHYYVNVIFYSFISLFGPMALYRVTTDLFNTRKLTLLISVFFVPSFFYWSSGLHKEGLLFVGVALILFHIYFAHKEQKWKASRWLGILLGLTILLLLRNFVLALIVPAILGWILANRWSNHGLASFVGVYLVCSVCFFGLRYIEPALDFPQAVVNKQQAFLQLVGNSSININHLEPTVTSFLINTPQAIMLSAARPYPSDVHHLLSLAAATETILFWLLLLLFLAFPLRQKVASKTTIYFCLFFSISLLLAIGFSVNNIGAIVRYRSIVLPLVVTFMVMHTNWSKPAKYFIQFKKNNNLNK
jgi:hypothetical protein